MSDSRLKENATAVKKLFGTAAKLAQKQAALATLNNVTLPKIYHAIGKKIVGLDKLPPDLVSHREKIRAIEFQMAARPEQPKAAMSEGVAAKAKHFAQQAAQKASKASTDAAATIQIHAAYVSLGKAAVEKYGDKAVPKDMASEFEAASSRAAELAAEIADLQQSSAATLGGPAMLAFAIYFGALVLPFMDHSGVCVGAQVLWGVSRDSWLGMFLVLFSHIFVVAGLSCLAARRALPKQATWTLWSGLAMSIALNTAWFVSYPRTFFAGFYLWYSLFVLLAFALWDRKQASSLNRAFESLQTVFRKWSRDGALALICFALSWTMPVTALFDDSAMTGWQAFRNALGGSWLAWASAATNLVAVMGLGLVLSWNRASPAASRLLLVASAASACVNGVWIFLFPYPLFLGFYLWLASFCLLATIAATQRESDAAAEVLSEPRNGSWARHSLAGLLVGLLVVLPFGRASVFAFLGGMSGNSAEVAEAAQSAPTSEVTGEPVNGAPSSDAQGEASTGMNAFVGMLMGMAFQQERQHFAEQRLQEQERALLRRQAREQQLQNSHVRYLSQPGGSYFGGQGGGGGYRPQKFQQYEGTCTRCGTKTGRQASQTYRKCSEMGVGPDGTIPCGGVIVWAPVQ